MGWGGRADGRSRWGRVRDPRGDDGGDPANRLLGFQALTRIKQSGMRMRGRRLAILAILFGLVFNTVTYGPRVLAFFTDSETSTLEGLSIGQCFDSDQFEDVTADVDPREPVELSKCSEPHDVELFARPKLTEDEIRFTDANVDAVETRERARCSSEFRAYSGVDMQSSGLNLVALRTQEPIGARTAGVVDCWAVPVTGKLDYSARHILDNEPRFTEARSMHSLEVGQCFDSNQRSGSSGAFAELDLQTIKTCDEPHDAELIARIKLPPGAFPGIPYLHPSDEELCADAFGDYVGTPFLGSSLDMVVLTPTEEAWDLGDDDIDCWVAPETGKKDFKAKNARR